MPHRDPTSTAEMMERHKAGFLPFEQFWREIEGLVEALETARTVARPAMAHQIDVMLDEVRAFEPSVSVIGQVKAGKSTLLNALIGLPGFLPSDVNPWTSVITAVHLNSRNRPPGVHALFRFFDETEWSRLIKSGGALGRLAARMGGAAEAEEISRQVNDVRRATEARLGPKFEALLGGQEVFDEINPEILRKYICHSDAEAGADDGDFYSDITRTADLYVDRPGYPAGFILRDTPGVNDTFLMREQITVKSISESRACVLVLSAHQALTNVDFGLLRLVMNVDARDVIIFVNRIDELDDPITQSIEIEASLQATLRKADMTRIPRIIFGSAAWAEHAFADSCATLSPRSVRALGKWSLSQSNTGDDVARPRMREVALDASGVVALLQAITHVIVEGAGKQLKQRTLALANNVMVALQAEESVGQRATNGRQLEQSVVTSVLGQISELEAVMAEESVRRTETAVRSLQERSERIGEAFIQEALDRLHDHIERYGETGNWRCDPAALRAKVRSAFHAVCTGTKRSAEASLNVIRDRCEQLLREQLGVPEAESVLEIPSTPAPKQPQATAATISLDLQPVWWRKYLRVGKSADQLHLRYEAVLRDEIDKMLKADLPVELADYCEKVEATVAQFIEVCKAALETALGVSTAQQADRSPDSDHTHSDTLPTGMAVDTSNIRCIA